MYLDYINTSLNGAQYHEDQAFLLKKLDSREYNKMKFHLRAYFWELWSVWDYILQYTNDQTLKLSPYLVRRNFLNILSKEIPGYKYLSLLKSIENDQRLSRIKWIRDYAHKWQINPYLIEYNDEKVNVISLENLDSQDKDLPKQINIDKNDLWFMKDILKTLREKKFI